MSTKPKITALPQKKRSKVFRSEASKRDIARQLKTWKGSLKEFADKHNIPYTTVCTIKRDYSDFVDKQNERLRINLTNEEKGVLMVIADRHGTSIEKVAEQMIRKSIAPYVEAIDIAFEKPKGGLKKSN